MKKHGTNRDEPKSVDEKFDEISLKAGEQPKALTWNSGLERVCDNTWTVRAAIMVKGTRFPATMTVYRDPSTGDVLLFNTLRLDDATNQAIIDLRASSSNTVHVMRLGAYHGKYDGYWCSTFPACKLWALPQHKLQPGLKMDADFNDQTFPVAGCKLFVFDFPRPEVVVQLPNKVAIFCDAVVNFSTSEYAGILGRIAMRMLGFTSAIHRPDPMYYDWMCKMSTQDKIKAEYERMLAELDFDTYTSGHGPALVGSAHSTVAGAVREFLSA